MLSYGWFFLIVLVSILSPVIGILLIIFYHLYEQKVYLLQMENRRINLERELQRIEYIQLSQQIQPHFLFNALNSLLSLARLKRLNDLITSFEHLALFIRYKYQPKKQLVPLFQEIDHIRHYIAIQKMRFGDRLEVRWDVEPSLTKAGIPPYLLQTLVENAFKHGLEQVEGKAILLIRLSLSAENDNKMVHLMVKDNGPGFSPVVLDSLKKNREGDPSSAGVGLKNIERRLDLLFPGRGKLMISSDKNKESGGIITVSWPLVLIEEDLLERGENR
ncbi:sensor histidine kinase [Thermicanus aegyptius]|uniref:sensor histidine kinase n=1 Tax=Thermicanus aegyptius TaxID=94009 RepID=UPI00048D25C1|nr:histidine kinase [Thermicanus aegyptius]